MSTLIEKINATLLKLGSDIQLAKAVKPVENPTGETSGQTLQPTTGNTLPSVVVTEYIPKNVKVSYSAIGAPVLEIDADDKEKPAEDGEYQLVTNKTITVKAGKLVTETDTPEDEQNEASGDTKMSVVEKPIIIEKVETPIELAANKSDQLMAALQRAGIDLKKKGNYCINIEIAEDGTIAYGTLQTNTFENLLMSKEEEFSTEMDKLTAAIETRLAAEKEKYEKLVEAHMHGIVPSKDKNANSETKMSKTDILKAQIANKVQTQE